MPFSPPSELDLFERGFVFSPTHNPDEVIFSYVREYPSGCSLTLTVTTGWDTELSAVLSLDSAVLCEIKVDGIGDFAFQSWDGERTIRVRSSVADLRIHYEPLPSIHLVSPPGAA